MPKPRCVYCGTKLSGGKVCRAHRDVARNDPQFHRILHNEAREQERPVLAPPPRGL